tara:strand:+ start:150 stop:446 length:297 start_codon:yes stop_codon:yes gene_type:complete
MGGVQIGSFGTFPPRKAVKKEEPKPAPPVVEKPKPKPKPKPEPKPKVTPPKKKDSLREALNRVARERNEILKTLPKPKPKAIKPKRKSNKPSKGTKNG